MAQKVLIIGESGTGKSCSIRNCDPKTTAIVSPEKEALPFGSKVQKYPGKFSMLCNETKSKAIRDFMQSEVKKGKKLIVIDDFQYILAIPYMNRIKETGWDKYNDFGSNYFEIIEECKKLPDDVVVVFMSHGETLENGLFTVKLIGKLLREKITIEGLFTVVLRTGINEGKYYFYTQNNGRDTTKSPLGMFPSFAIDNDLEYVADKIRNYYELEGAKSDAEMSDSDKAVAAEIEKPEGGRTRRGRKAKATEEYIEKASEKLEEVADGREKVPFEEAAEAVTPSTGTGRIVYYHDTADDNYLKAYDTEPKKDTWEEITEEEFIEGAKKIAFRSASKETQEVFNEGESAPRTRRQRRVR